MADDPSVSELLEEEIEAEHQFLAAGHVVTSHLPGEITLKHSATTDTLDSVLLEPSVIDDDNNTDDDIQADDILQDDENNSKNTGGDAVVLSEEVVDKSSEGIFQISADGGHISEALGGDQSNKASHDSAAIETQQLDISSYFSDNKIEKQGEDPFQTFFDTLPENSEDKSKESVINLSELAEDEREQQQPDTDSQISLVESESVHPHTIESQTSQVEPESVAFEVVPEETGVNIMETSLQVIDDKEDFESFTAETASEDIIQEFNNLGISPSNKILSQGTEDSLTDSASNTYDRQLSSSSQLSGGSLVPAAQTSPMTSPVHQPFQGTPFSPTQFSPFATPTHHPLVRDKPVHISPSSSPSYLTKDQPAFTAQQVVMEETQAVPTSPTQASNLSPTFEPVPEVSPPHTTGSSLSATFQSLQDGSLDDPFTASLQMSDGDRQRDAWIPSDATRHILVTMATSIPGTFIPTLDQLSTPGLIVDEPQGDPVKDLVQRYMGEQEAINRQILSVDTVTQDVDGLKKLLEGGCFRSAIDMTGRLLTVSGQGPGKAGTLTQHTPQGLQLWFTRLALLMKLRLYSIAETEYQAFQGLDTPDLYYEFYPHIFPGRKGSMVPFGMRVLHAELPHYLGRSQEALDRLYYVLAITQKILKNLDEGLCEDGSAVEIPPESRKASQELWTSREIQVLYVIGNTLLAIKDFEAAMSVYDSLLDKDTASKASLLSGMGRIYLQMGNVIKAKDCFKQSEILSDSSQSSAICRNYINRGLEAMCTNNFTEAYQEFKLAVEADPTNASAVNNMAVCSLYLGKLKDALKTLEILVHDDPDKNLHEGVLFNLCTLYELESSRALHKKQALLDLVSRHKGDGFPVACLKMS